jgi:hypothetical protein
MLTFAWAALIVCIVSQPLLTIAHVRWWQRAKAARHLDEQLFPRVGSQRVRESLGRMFVRFLVAFGWMLILAFGFATSTIFENAGYRHIADMVYELGGWVAFSSFLVACVLLGFWLKGVIDAGFAFLNTAAKHAKWTEASSEALPLMPLAGKPSGRLIRWLNWGAGSIFAVTVPLLLMVKFGWWRPPDAVLTLLLVILFATLLVGTAVGWYCDWRERQMLKSLALWYQQEYGSDEDEDDKNEMGLNDDDE